MRRIANHTVRAADSSKMGELFFVKVMNLKKGDILVTDKIPEEWHKKLDERGVRVVLCSAE